MRRYILLVEDNPDDQALTLRALKKNNTQIDVVIAHDGKEALDILLSRNGRHEEGAAELILLDLKLPKIDGHGVLKEIRSEREICRLPVIILSSSNEERDILISYDLGANSYIRKPVDFTEFNNSLRQLTDYWLGLNVSPVFH